MTLPKVKTKKIKTLTAKRTMSNAKDQSLKCQSPKRRQESLKNVARKTLQFVAAQNTSNKKWQQSQEDGYLHELEL